MQLDIVILLRNLNHFEFIGQLNTMAGFVHFCPFIICMQKPVEISCFTIQIIISAHDTSFKKFIQKYENWWIFALISLI